MLSYLQPFLFCTENSGLDLNVSLKNNPPTPSVNPVPFPPDPSIDVDFLSEGFVRDGKIYPIGNITFTCLTNRTTATTYYKYSFGDEESEPYTQDGNLTHEYSKVGVYEYVVDAVALTGRGNRGFHAAHTGHIYIMGKLEVVRLEQWFAGWWRGRGR